MADVRALLRNERLARRITHPHATYSAAGTLSCNVCNLRLQAESLWKPHLAGKVHRQNLERVQAAKVATQAQSSTDTERKISASSHSGIAGHNNGGGTGRKRKVDDESEDEVQQTTGKKRKAADSESEEEYIQEIMSRKKSKAAANIGHANGDLSAGKVGDSGDKQEEVVLRPSTVVDQSAPASHVNIDEDEYAAFEAAIAAAPAEDDNETAQNAARNLLQAGGDVAAAPITATELAAATAEDPNAQGRSKRDEELEEEKEDAARALEEEFDEMDQLEARVKKLRERREALRASDPSNVMDVDAEIEQDPVKLAVDEESDDDDDWGFR